jgi:hypothetical protein
VCHFRSNDSFRSQIVLNWCRSVLRTPLGRTRQSQLNHYQCAFTQLTPRPLHFTFIIISNHHMELNVPKERIRIHAFVCCACWHIKIRLLKCARVNSGESTLTRMSWHEAKLPLSRWHESSSVQSNSQLKDLKNQHELFFKLFTTANWKLQKLIKKSFSIPRPGSSRSCAILKIDFSPLSEGFKSNYSNFILGWDVARLRGNWMASTSDSNCANASVSFSTVQIVIVIIFITHANQMHYE